MTRAVMATTDRPEGYYWVRAKENSLEPARWHARRWWVTGRNRSFSEAEVLEVGGRVEPDTVAELCAALETAVGLMTEILISSSWPGPTAIAELRNMLAEVLARARGEGQEG